MRAELLTKPDHMASERKLGGIFCYLATPFDCNGDVDFGQLRDYVDDMLTVGLDGLTCLASTCEGPYLTEAEWREVLAQVGRSAGGKIRLNVGVGAYSTRQVIENAKRAKDAGATSLMIEAQQYYRLTFDEVYRHYATIAEAVDVPIRLYNLTIATRFDFTPALLRKMASIENIVSVKEASGDVTRLGEIRALCRDRYKLFCGFHFQVLDGLRLGANGWEVMMHPLIAGRLVQLYSALRLDPWSAHSEALFERLKPMFEFFRNHGVPQSIKAMSNWTSMPFGAPRRPQRSLDEAETQQLRTILSDCGIL